MSNKKIDTKKLSKIVKSVDLKKIKKGVGGKVITEIISKAEKTKDKIKPKDTYVVHSDYTAHADYTEHSNHGKSIHGKSIKAEDKTKRKK